MNEPRIIGEEAIWRLIWQNKAMAPETTIFYIMVATVLFGLGIFVFFDWYRTCERGFHTWKTGRCEKCGIDCQEAWLVYKKKGWFKRGKKDET